MGPPTGGQPPMGPPTGGQPPMGPPPGGPGMPGAPGDPYNPGDPYGHGGDPYNQGGAPYGQPGDPYAQQHGDPYAAPPVDPYGNPYGQQPPQQKKKSPWLFLGLGCAALFVIGVVLVVLLVVVFNGDDPSVEPRDPGGTSQNEEPGGEEPQEPADPDEPAAPEIDTSDMWTVGSEFEHAGLTYVITGVDVVDELEGYTPTGEYLVVEIDVADAEGSASWFWMDEQHVYEADGTQYEEDYDLTRQLNDDSAYVTLGDEGEFSSVTVAFDVPDASAITHMGVSSETYGGNETNVSLVD
ncbi:hypothetical protein ACIBFB_17710 [Nocardiopsis sp. NPDC050513]|uniref:hypothetical protein n=1 Tax=Nocardiopsis sp. NPDC050513 TaxID=3364338 RepID=UPI0037B67351